MWHSAATPCGTLLQPSVSQAATLCISGGARLRGTRCGQCMGGQRRGGRALRAREAQACGAGRLPHADNYDSLTRGQALRARDLTAPATHGSEASCRACWTGGSGCAGCGVAVCRHCVPGPKGPGRLGGTHAPAAALEPGSPPNEPIPGACCIRPACAGASAKVVSCPEPLAQSP